jgi:hypothetical protein
MPDCVNSSSVTEAGILSGMTAKEASGVGRRRGHALSWPATFAAGGKEQSGIDWIHDKRRYKRRWMVDIRK